MRGALKKGHVIPEFFRAKARKNIRDLKKSCKWAIFIDPGYFELVALAQNSGMTKQPLSASRLYNKTFIYLIDKVPFQNAKKTKCQFVSPFKQHKEDPPCPFLCLLQRHENIKNYIIE